MNSLKLIGLICVMLVGASAAFADSVYLKSGEEVRGLVVEEHADRILLSTVDGEQTIRRAEIERIDFNDPAYELLSKGRDMERRGKHAQALAYYEKAIEMNPKLQDARKAALAIRSKYWSDVASGPVSEISKMQDFENAYRANTDVAEQTAEVSKSSAESMIERWGMKLISVGDETKAVDVAFGGPGHKAGFREADIIVAIDGKSMRYLSAENVMQMFLMPVDTRVNVQVERNVTLERNGAKNWGFEPKQDYESLTAQDVDDEGAAHAAGLKDADYIVAVEGIETRYMPAREARKKINKQKDKLELTIRRNLQTTRI